MNAFGNLSCLESPGGLCVNLCCKFTTAQDSKLGERSSQFRDRFIGFSCSLCSHEALSSWGMPPKWSFRYMTHLKVGRVLGAAAVRHCSAGPVGPVGPTVECWQDRSWRAWASYRAAVVLPYDPQTLATCLHCLRCLHIAYIPWQPTLAQAEN